MAYLCETYSRLPDDPFITEMDSVQKMWLFNNWIANQNEQAELAKNHAYLIASYFSPEAAQAIQDIVNTGNKHQSTDEEFEETIEGIRSGSLDMLDALKIEQPIKRKRKRQIKQD